MLFGLSEKKKKELNAIDYFLGLKVKFMKLNNILIHIKISII